MNRVAFGLVLIAGAFAMWARAIEGRSGDGPHVSDLVILTWPLAALANLVVGAIADRSRSDAARIRTASVVLPSIGAALLLPLTLHLIFFAVTTGTGEPLARDFDEWAQLSALVACVPHVVFAIGLSLRTVGHVTGRPTSSPWALYAWAVVASAIPFGVLYGLPPLIVAATGLPIVAVMAAIRAPLEREAAREASELPVAAVVVAA